MQKEIELLKLAEAVVKADRKVLQTDVKSETNTVLIMAFGIGILVAFIILYSVYIR